MPYYQVPSIIICNNKIIIILKLYQVATATIRSMGVWWSASRGVPGVLECNKYCTQVHAIIKNNKIYIYRCIGA